MREKRNTLKIKYKELDDLCKQYTEFKRYFYRDRVKIKFYKFLQVHKASVLISKIN